MPTSRYTSQALPQKQQVTLARQEGTFLASLYCLPAGFFCELLLAVETLVVLSVRTFTGPSCPDTYTNDIKLDELNS